MTDLWERTERADASVSLLLQITKLSGWKRAVKVAVTSRCTEGGTTSALPAVSELTGASYNQGD